MCSFHIPLKFFCPICLTRNHITLYTGDIFFVCRFWITYPVNCPLYHKQNLVTLGTENNFLCVYFLHHIQFIASYTKRIYITPSTEANFLVCAFRKPNTIYSTIYHTKIILRCTWRIFFLFVHFANHIELITPFTTHQILLHCVQGNIFFVHFEHHVQFIAQSDTQKIILHWVQGTIILFVHFEYDTQNQITLYTRIFLFVCCPFRVPVPVYCPMYHTQYHHVTLCTGSTVFILFNLNIS